MYNESVNSTICLLDISRAIVLVPTIERYFFFTSKSGIKNVCVCVCVRVCSKVAYPKHVYLITIAQYIPCIPSDVMHLSHISAIQYILTYTDNEPNLCILSFIIKLFRLLLFSYLSRCLQYYYFFLLIDNLLRISIIFITKDCRSDCLTQSGDQNEF